MKNWQQIVVDHTTQLDFTIQNLFVEGTPIACGEALDAAKRLCDCLAGLSLEEVPDDDAMVSEYSSVSHPHPKRREVETDSIDRKRCLKVHELGDRYAIRQLGQERSVPMIQLRGKWLREAGFAAGQNVVVTVQYGRLSIMVAEGQEGHGAEIAQ